MRRLSLSDTIFYNLGDCYMNAVAVLDGPCDLAMLLAEVEGVIETMPALTERSVRVGAWTFAKPTSEPVDLSKHVAIVRDPTITSIDKLVPRVDTLRRSPIRIDGPSWRIFVLNPEGPGDQENEGEKPLSVLFMQMRHGLADAVRGLQILSRMGRYESTARHEKIAASLPTIDPLSLRPEITVHDPGLSFLQIPRRGMIRDGDASERLAAVVATAVADSTLFPNAQPLRGNLGRTRFIRRRTSNGVGNALKMVTVSTRSERERKKQVRIPGVARAQNLQFMQWLVALAPRRLARKMMKIWYSTFDGVATLIPMPRNMALGGRQVTATFGVPPLWGPVPLAMVVLADGEHYNATLIPGNGFTANRALLLDRVRRLLNPEKGDDISDVEEMLEIISRQRPDQPGHGQGADGRSSSPVSLPARAKSP